MWRSFSVFLSTLAIAGSASAQGQYDVLIRNGRVLDGSGNPWFRADLGIQGERIVAIEAARIDGFRGRFVYMTSIGVRRRSLFTVGLNLWKGGTVHRRHLAENAIRASGIEYCIIRSAFLLNRPGGQRAVVVRQVETALGFREAIARADVAEALVEALRHPCAARATLEVAWASGRRSATWTELFNILTPDHTERHEVA